MRHEPIIMTLLAVGLVLAGCSAPWQAPVERRASYNPSGGPIDGPTYRVKSGDTLYGIAWRAGVDHQDLAAWNRIAPPYTIYVNQTLSVVPGRVAGGAKRAASVTPPAKKNTAVSKPVAGPGKKASTASVKSTLPVKKAPPAKAKKTISRPSGSLRWSWPAKGKVVQRFSPSDPSRKGIKIRGKRGQVVKASEAGEVVYSGSGLVGYGQLIIIKHNKDFLSAYGHNAKRLVREGESVTKGKVIAEMGIAAGQPQLHFEIRRRGKPVDPLALLPRR